MIVAICNQQMAADWVDDAAPGAFELHSVGGIGAAALAQHAPKRARFFQEKLTAERQGYWDTAAVICI